ncbi:MAG: hypothetical protein KIS79_08635 [Burkholderiales bacterium]|nr:hypothetical protein [Burkholderiales bacterium]
MNDLAQRSCEDMLRAALPHATAQQLAALILAEDPQAARLSARRAHELVDAALTDGVELAARVAQQWGHDPDQIAAAAGIEVIDVDGSNDYGSTRVYAEYLPRGSRVYLYRPALAAIDRHLCADGLAALLGVYAAREVFLAHELYHHFDLTRAAGPLASRHRVVLLTLGRWRWTSGLSSLAEIAAGAFAQSLLELRCHAKLLDVLTLFDHAPQAAERFVRRLRETGETGEGDIQR